MIQEIKISPSITQDGDIEVDIRPRDENTDVLAENPRSPEEKSLRVRFLPGGERGS